MSIEKNGFVFTTPVWGSYIYTFMDICIPSLLADGNLPAIDVPAVYLIHTTIEDAFILEQSHIFSKLKQVIDVKIDLIETQIIDSYRTITWCHQQAFNYADNLDAGIFIIVPDSVMATNYCAHLQKLAKDGARLISVPNFRITIEDSRDDLLNFVNSNDDLSIDARSLMQIGTRNLHNMTKASIWEKSAEYLLPCILFWKIANSGGLIGRYFYGCFTYVYPVHKHTKMHATMDLDYIFQACPDESLHYACTNSDDALTLEMSPRDRYSAGFPKVFVEHLRYYASHLNQYQINHSKHVFKLLTGFGSEDDIRNAENESLQVLNQVYELDSA